MKNLRTTFAAIALGMASLTAFAAPSPKDVEDAIRAQNWTGAQQMLTEVTAAKPHSAKAWYFLAQTEEKLGHTGAAQVDLQRAETEQPDLKFASPGSVKMMEQRLSQQTAVVPHQRSYTTTTTTTRNNAPMMVHHDSGFGLVAVLLSLMFISFVFWGIWRLFFYRPVIIAGGYNGGVGYGGAGYGGGVGYGPGGGTVVVNGGNNSTGLLETMIIADALSDGHRHGGGGYYRDDSSSTTTTTTTSWDNDTSSSSSPSSSGGFDLGGGGSSWDSGSSSSGGFDSGSSSSGGDW